MAPFAPHIAEELWEQLGHATTVCDAPWPECQEQYLKEDSETISVSFNGKTRFTLDLPTDISREDAEKAARDQLHQMTDAYMSAENIRRARKLAEA